MRGHAPPLRMSNCTLVSAQYGVYLAPDDDVVTSHLELRGAHTRPYLAMALALIRSGDTVLDIGAHIGSFTIPLARAVGPAGRVFAFEPNASTRELLEINVELNDVGNIVETLPVALARKAKEYAISVDRSNTGAAYLRRVDATAGGAVSITLDHWADEAGISGVDFVKLDVEGMESDVLAGGSALLERSRPAMLVEVDSSQLNRFGSKVSDLNDLLVGRGYRIFLHTGGRNVARDEYDAAEIMQLMEGTELYDVLAVHTSSERLAPFLHGVEAWDPESVASDVTP